MEERLYRLKHVPTGLYYSPVKGKYDNITNLTKKGKIYQSNANCLIGKGDTITIRISERQYELFKDKLISSDLYKCRYQSGYNLRSKKTDFEKEYIV